MSLREVRVRSKQELTKLSERWLNLNSSELSDSAFLSEIHLQARDGSGPGTAALIAGRIRSYKGSTGGTFFPSFSFRDEIVAQMEQRFPAQRSAIIDRADRVMKGRFDLLGYADLRFGEPVDWHLEPVSGKRTSLNHWSRIDFLNAETAGDKKITWELNRNQFFITLGQAYWLTGDEAFVGTFVKLANSWMDANPPKRGINWASSLEVSFRAIAWLWALHLCAESSLLTTRFVTRLLKYLVAHGCHIESYLSHFFSPNTHLTGEALGLFYLGTALPELRRARIWRETGLKIMLEQMPIHVRRDGVYFEQSSYYHRYTADFYTHLRVLARASSPILSGDFEDRLERSIEHLMWITRPDGSSPYFGDDDGGRLVMLGIRDANDFRDTLATGAALLERKDWKFVAGEPAVETLWLLGPKGIAAYDQLEADPPREKDRAFGESGYFVMRDGWTREAGYVLIDCGSHGSPKGCGHAHADALAIEFAAEGMRWLVDPGTFTYTGDAKARDEFRSTAAHNTVTVDDEPQSVPVGPFAWSRIAESQANKFITEIGISYFEGSHNGYKRLADPVEHTRSLLFIKADPETGVPAYLMVVDRFKATKNHRYAIRYHFQPGSRTVVEGNRIRIIDQSGSELIIHPFANLKLQTRVTDGWISECYGQRHRAPVAVIEADGFGPQEIVTIIAPVGNGRVFDAYCHFATNQSLGISLKSGDARDFMIVGQGAGHIACSSLTSSGSLAWGRFIGDRITQACLIEGTRFEAKDLSFRALATAEYFSLHRARNRVNVTVNCLSHYDLLLPESHEQVVINGASNNHRYSTRGAKAPDNPRSESSTLNFEPAGR